MYSRRNILLDPNVDAKIRKLEADEERSGKRTPMLHAPGVTADSLPRGVSQVPFTVSDERSAAAKAMAMEFLAGAVVVTQDVDTGALRPSLGWAVREAPQSSRRCSGLPNTRSSVRGAGFLTRALRARDVNFVPTDVLRFYREVETAVMHGNDGLSLYRVLSFSDWTEPERAPGRPRAPRLFRFAECTDGTEVLIELPSGAVRVGRGGDGRSLPETGRQIAPSFTDFLLRALDGGREPYFRHEGFVPSR